MPTTIVKHIGLGTGNGYDWSGANAIPNWINSLSGLDLTVADQIQQGILHFNGTGDGEFARAGIVADFSGVVSLQTDSTRYVELTTAPGQNFNSVLANPLYFDATKGAALRNTGSSGVTVNTGSIAYLRISNLQIAGDAGSNGVLMAGNPGLLTLDSCIFSGTESYFNTSSVALVKNCVFINLNGPFTRILGIGGASTTFDFCTIVAPSSSTKTTAIQGDTGNYTCNSCGIFGITNVAGGSAGTFVTCATNAASPPTGCSTVTYAPQFVSTVNNFRQNTTTPNGLYTHGTAIGITTDVFGNTRKSPPDIGAHELVSAAAPSSGFIKFSPFLGIAAAEEWLRRRKAQVKRDEG